MLSRHSLRVCAEQSVPLSHYKSTICAGGWCVGRVNWGVSKAQAVLPSPEGSSEWSLSRDDLHCLVCAAE